jgi:hypothetical protein
MAECQTERFRSLRQLLQVLCAPLTTFCYASFQTWQVVNQIPEAKATFVRQALGLSGDLPELARL